MRSLSPALACPGDAAGSFTEVSARPNGASVHIHLAKNGPEAPAYFASWPAEGWSRIDVVEEMSTRQPGLDIYFSPYKTFDSIRLPHAGESMLLPPSDGPHYLRLFTDWGGDICLDDDGEHAFMTCSSDYFLTYDVHSVPAPVPGDANFDNTVGFSDFLTLSKNFGIDNLLITWNDGDFDLNRRVDLAGFCVT